MIFHLYIRWALPLGLCIEYLLRKGILRHFLQKITKKACSGGFPSRKFIFCDRNSILGTDVVKRMLLILEHVALA